MPSNAMSKSNGNLCSPGTHRASALGGRPEQAVSPAWVHLLLECASIIPTGPLAACSGQLARGTTEVFGLSCFLSNFSGIKIYMPVGVTGGKKDSVLEAQTSDLRWEKSMHFAVG